MSGAGTLCAKLTVIELGLRPGEGSPTHTTQDERHLEV